MSNTPNVPKNFLLKCQQCCHARMTTGLTVDLKDLHEYQTCTNCGGVRKFRCPQCGGQMKMRRVKFNGEA